MTPNVVTIGGYPSHQHAFADSMQQQTFDQTDALLGELLRQVLEMRRDVEAVQAAMTDLVGALREKPQPAMPPNALRHSR